MGDSKEELIKLATRNNKNGSDYTSLTKTEKISSSKKKSNIKIVNFTPLKLDVESKVSKPKSRTRLARYGSQLNANDVSKGRN